MVGRVTVNAVVLRDLKPQARPQPVNVGFIVGYISWLDSLSDTQEAVGSSPTPTTMLV